MGIQSPSDYPLSGSQILLAKAIDDGFYAHIRIKTKHHQYISLGINNEEHELDYDFLDDLAPYLLIEATDLWSAKKLSEDYYKCRHHTLNYFATTEQKVHSEYQQPIPFTITSQGWMVLNSLPEGYESMSNDFFRDKTVLMYPENHGLKVDDTFWVSYLVTYKPNEYIRHSDELIQERCLKVHR